jgi:glucose dehydrogenase
LSLLNAVMSLQSASTVRYKKSVLQFFRLTLCVAISGPLWSNHAHAADAQTSGAAVFQSQCARCHGDQDLSAQLRANWSGRGANELLQRIRTTMPADAPGSLTDAEYLRVAGHLLNSIGTRVDESTLTPASLERLTIRASDAQSQVTAQPDVGWLSLNGNLAAQRYSPLDQINAENGSRLTVAWRLPTAMFGPTPESKNVSSPIVANGSMFATVGQMRDVIAVDPGTGQLLWMWRANDKERFERSPRKGSGRGVAYWQSGSKQRVLTVTPGYFLVSLDARTGEPDPEFGHDGVVDLQEGLRRAVGRSDLDITLTMPPFVINDVIIVGSSHQVGYRPPSKANVKGDVRAFDAATGKLLWTFHTIPAAGEPGEETWLRGSAEYTGNAGVWAPMSADPELGLVYLPVEGPTGDRYGGDRPGANLFSSSLVAVDVKTGERRWHYQIVHHDIWDFDNPSAPILCDLSNGRKVVVQLTKQAFAYVLDRRTGKPIWPIRERRVPQTTVSGEWTSPTQPFPSRPAPFDRQGISESDLIDLTPEILAAAKEAVKPYRMGPLFTPASLANAPDGTKGTLTLPSSTGGANWEGGAFDPETGLLYVPSRTAAEVLALVSDSKASSVKYVQGNGRPPTALGLPIVRPPWGRITAIDLQSGDHKWWIANADTPREVAENPAVANIALGRTGIPTRAGLLVTKTLLFAGEGWGGTAVLRTHDKASGKIVSEVHLPAAQAGQPITYMHRGKQFIAMFIGDGKSPAELVALSLPEPTPARRPTAASEE